MKKIAVLIENNFEESELLYPYHRFREDFEVDLVGSEKDKEYIGKSGGLKVKSNIASSEVKASDYEAVYVPGGYSPDAMRKCQATIDFVKKMHDDGKIVAAICHGPWLLVEAGILDGVKATSVKQISTDLKNAGAIWVDEETVVDNKIITARTPKDLPVQIKKIVEELNK